MKKGRNKNIIYGILSTCALFMICGVITITNIPATQLADHNTTSIETNIQVENNNSILSIADITEKIDSDKIIDITSEENENACLLMSLI